MKYLIIAAIAWIVAQLLKHVARLFGRNRRIFGSTNELKLLLSGGMPSAHSATTVALSFSIGYYEGFDSAVFALSLLFAAVVIYDAVMVRYSSGQQGVLVNRLAKAAKIKARPIRVAHGHTVLEVIAGALIGVLVAVVVISTTNYL